MAETRKIEVILSKKEWEEILSGKSGSIQTFRDSNAHYYFDDNPQEEAVRVEIIER